jgi:hypothetical protein
MGSEFSITWEETMDLLRDRLTENELDLVIDAVEARSLSLAHLRLRDVVDGTFAAIEDARESYPST